MSGQISADTAWVDTRRMKALAAVATIQFVGHVEISRLRLGICHEVVISSLFKIIIVTLVDREGTMG